MVCHTNFHNVNCKKTKEMFLSAFNRASVDLLELNNVETQSVSSSKLLGVNIVCNLKWNSHIDSICSKANTRVYFIKHLKRSGVELEDLLHFYFSVVRPVLEYACPAWHTGLTRDQSDRLETVQKRALSIIFNVCS